MQNSFRLKYRDVLLNNYIDKNIRSSLINFFDKNKVCINNSINIYIYNKLNSIIPNKCYNSNYMFYNSH